MSSANNQDPPKKQHFRRKLTKDGKPNPRYVDLLETDKPLAGQAYGCFSFLSPEKEIKQREMFFFEAFVRQWEMNKAMEKFHQFLNYLAYKYRLNPEDVMKDLEAFVEEERASLQTSSVEDDYKNFLDRKEEDLMRQFNEKHKFQTSVRGFMARGNFPTLEEAEMRAKMLREYNPNFDIFVGPVGVMIPWDPEAYKTGRVEYLEEELNQLAHEKKKNEDLAKSAFEKRVRETKQKAMEENKQKAEQFGTKLTQDIDEEGNLVGVNAKSAGVERVLDTDFAQPSAEEGRGPVTAEDVRRALFEGDNIVTGKSDYGQSQLVSGPFATQGQRSGGASGDNVGSGSGSSSGSSAADA